ncbi:conidial yellow pigment biosynthesis polyketide synthase [Cladorrhinum sp. PSN332]|nr:conidial yellow pigment biosynthesis polyketide synthase [Cladorrhinum sp. PSN332]
MWLLDVNTLDLCEFHGDRTPPYAILSHVWGLEEVTFQDLKSPKGRKAARKTLGFSKVERCCRQAKRDGYSWAWVDSCCINKSSSAELSEAINSMFHWYERSARCYVFLDDLFGDPNDNDDYSWRLRGSRWFMRGWTLQELLAPQHVVFFDHFWFPFGHIRKLNGMADSQDGRLLDLTRQVSAITRIPTKYLQGTAALSQACVAQRMYWASRRQTTRAEDRAYCLLGLFDISMPILYGEGASKAFARLQSEIMKENPDQTILAWYRTDITSYRLLAESPGDFDNSEHVEQLRREASGSAAWSSFFMTNLGLSIKLPVTTTLNADQWSPGTLVEALLKCTASSRAPGHAAQKISLSLIFFDRDSEGRPIFICRRPPTWIFNTREGSPMSIVVARNAAGGMSRAAPSPANASLSSASQPLDIVSRGIHILASETGIKVESLGDQLLLDDIGVDSLLTLTIGGRIYEELGLSGFGGIGECKTVGDFRSRLQRYLASRRSLSPSGRASPATDPTPESTLVAGIKAWRKASSVLLAGSDATATRNLFMAPDAAGSSRYSVLLSTMPDHWALWGLMSPFRKVPVEYDCGIKELSSRLVEEMKRRQPVGPYSLAGWSTGGIVAYEMARQIIERGEEVELLIVIDDLCPGTVTKSQRRLPSNFVADLSSKYVEWHPTSRVLIREGYAQLHVAASIAAVHEYVAEPIATDKCPKVWIIWCEDDSVPDVQFWNNLHADCSVSVGSTESVPGNRLLCPEGKMDGFGPNGWDKLLDEGKMQIRRVAGNHFVVIRDNIDWESTFELRNSLKDLFTSLE